MNSLVSTNTRKTSNNYLAKPNDIVLFKGNGNYTWIFMANGTKRLVCKTMHTVLNEIQQLYFVRIHKSYSININHIKSKEIYGDMALTMTNGMRAEVSRRKKKEFLAKLNFLN